MAIISIVKLSPLELGLAKGMDIPVLVISEKTHLQFDRSSIDLKLLIMPDLIYAHGYLVEKDADKLAESTGNLAKGISRTTIKNQHVFYAYPRSSADLGPLYRRLTRQY